jgi:hypothetical protein
MGIFFGKNFFDFLFYKKVILFPKKHYTPKNFFSLDLENEVNFWFCMSLRGETAPDPALSMPIPISTILKKVS